MLSDILELNSNLEGSTGSLVSPPNGDPANQQEHVLEMENLNSGDQGDAGSDDQGDTSPERNTSSQALLSEVTVEVERDLNGQRTPPGGACL